MEGFVREKGGRARTVVCGLSALLGLSGLAEAKDFAHAAPASHTRIVIQKSQRRLLLYTNGRLTRSYKIALGLNPTDDKRREGDRCTPEGQFLITGKNSRSHFIRSLVIGYPNRSAATRGLHDGLITIAQYRRIMMALRRHRTPPQDTLLGGNIMIHGGGTARDWTWGCAALENRDIEAFYNSIENGTPVVITH